MVSHNGIVILLFVRSCRDDWPLIQTDSRKTNRWPVFKNGTGSMASPLDLAVRATKVYPVSDWNAPVIYYFLSNNDSAGYQWLLKCLTGCLACRWPVCLYHRAGKCRLGELPFVLVFCLFARSYVPIPFTTTIPFHPAPFSDAHIPFSAWLASWGSIVLVEYEVRHAGAFFRKV